MLSQGGEEEEEVTTGMRREENGVPFRAIQEREALALRMPRDAPPEGGAERWDEARHFFRFSSHLLRIV